MTGTAAVAEGVSPLPAASAADEPELVERVRRGDAAAFDQLMALHLRRAFSVAYRLLGQREDAEDLVQEAFITVLEKIDTFQPGRSFGPWFYRILVNRGLNSRKSRTLRRTEEIPLDAASAGVSPLREAEQAELRDHLAGAMAGLPPRQQTIVRLFELEGFTSGEIAEILEMPDGTVRWHLHQARQKLREALAPFAKRNP